MNGQEGMGSPPSPDRSVPWLVFDGDCAFCTTTAMWLQRHLARHDGHDALLTPWQFTDLAALGTTTDRARSEVLWVTSQGEVSGGAEAFATWLVHRGGAYGVGGRLIRLPVIRTIAAAGYRLIARNRHRLPGGTPACALPPPGGPSPPQPPR